MDILKMNNGEFYDYVRTLTNRELIELSAQVNSLKIYLDTYIKHDLGLEPEKVTPEKPDSDIKNIPAVPNIQDDPLKTVAEVSEYLHLSEVTIYKHIKQGKIISIKIGDKHRIALSQFTNLKK